LSYFMGNKRLLILRMLRKLFSEKRVQICTFVALASGLFGAYLGGQMNVIARTQQCQDLIKLKLPGKERLCRIGVTPLALWQGSTSGLWVGVVLGAFVGGVVTREQTLQTPEEEAASLSPKEREVLQRALLPLAMKSLEPVGEGELDFPLLKEPEALKKLTRSQVSQLLLALGFSDSAIEAVWQEVTVARMNDEG
jgi:hypothetical protein